MKKILTGFFMVAGYFIIYLVLSALFAELLLPVYVSIFKGREVVLALYSLTFALLTAVFLYYFSKTELKKGFKDFRANIEKNIVMMAVYIGAMYAILIGINLIMLQFGLLEVSDNQQAINEMVTKVPFLMFVFASIVAPFIEELAFRLGIRKMIKNNAIFLIVSSVVFGYIHVMGGDYMNIFPYIGLGLVLGYAYLKTDNLFFVVLVHGFYNAISFMLTTMI